MSGKKVSVQNLCHAAQTMRTSVHEIIFDLNQDTGCRNQLTSNFNPAQTMRTSVHEICFEILAVLINIKVFG